MKFSSVIGFCGTDVYDMEKNQRRVDATLRSDIEGHLEGFFCFFLFSALLIFHKENQPNLRCCSNLLSLIKEHVA